MKNITAAEILEREEAYWKNYKPSQEYLDAEEKALRPILDQLLKLARKHELLLYL